MVEEGKAYGEVDGEAEGDEEVGKIRETGAAEEETGEKEICTTSSTKDATGQRQRVRERERQVQRQVQGQRHRQRGN